MRQKPLIKSNETCVIIGASHAGVTAAFAVRKEGWLGRIILIDSDPNLPYHRPPLSKAYLTQKAPKKATQLKPLANYEKHSIELMLGKRVTALDCSNKTILLENDDNISFDKLIIATGARPFIPPIHGVDTAKNVFTLRTKADVDAIAQALENSSKKRVVIIGGGYIGLETAASIKKIGGEVTVLEREERLLARVTSPEMSAFFLDQHANHEIAIQTGKNVTAIHSKPNCLQIKCEGEKNYEADVVIIGVGILVNSELAHAARIVVENGIRVNGYCQTSDEDVYAIGDCAFHYNKFYDRWLRLESVQNAVEQAKVAAINLNAVKPSDSAISAEFSEYDALPWFWSDQFDLKLQMVGLSHGYDNLVKHVEDANVHSFSVWYFRGDQLLAVDTVNHAKAYVLATKILKVQHSGDIQVIDKNKLASAQVLSLESII